MVLTILRGYTDQQVQLNILDFCDLTGTYDSEQHDSAHLWCILVETLMEVTSSSSTWSHRPEPDLIGVSVFKNQNQFSLRFHLRATHLERINKPKTLGIRGSAQNGFILTPNSETGIKPS